MEVTITGPKSVYPRRGKIKVGDTVLCRKAFSPTYGKTVEAYFDGDQVGFVSAQPRTTLVGCLMASDVFDNEDIKDEFEVTIGSIEDDSTGMVVFRATIMEEEKMENVNVNVNAEVAEGGEKKYKDAYSFVVGSKKVYQYRYDPIKILKSGEVSELDAELEMESDKILVYYKDPNTGEKKPCGHLMTTADEKIDAAYKNDEELREFINQYKVDGEMPEIEAKIVGVTSKVVSAINLDIRIRVYGQTAMEAALEEMAGDIDAEKFTELSDFINSLKVTEAVATEVFKMVKDSLPQDESRIPTKTVFNNSDEMMEDVVYSIVSGANTMLSGPMAAGKNTCLETLAYHFGKALYEVQVNSYIDNDVLLGTRTIVARDGAANAEEINRQGRALIQALAEAFRGTEKAEMKREIEAGSVEAVETIQAVSGVDFSVLIQAMKDAQTEVDFQPGVIPIAMETGSWVVVDEFNAGPPAVMAVLNSVLDNRKRIQVPGYGLVKAAPGFRLFATMNPNYEGTFTLNPATASRFNHVLFKAADSISPIILSRVPEAGKDFLKAAEKCYKNLRSGIDSGKNQEDSINVRGFIEAAKQNVMGRSIKRSLMTCVVNGIADMDDRKAMQSFVEINIGD